MRCSNVYPLMAIIFIFSTCKSRRIESAVKSETEDDQFAFMLEHIQEFKGAIESSLKEDTVHSGKLKLGDERTGENISLNGDVIVHENNAANLGAFSVSTIPWPKGVIPYRISDDVSSQLRININNAILELNNKTNALFVEADSDSYKTIARLNQIDQQSVLIFRYGKNLKAMVCAADLGYQSTSKPLVYLTEQCNTGTIIHELVHTLGFNHEQTRPDRDQYVMILQSNFEKPSKDNDGEKLTPADQYIKFADFLPAVARKPYDYNSIMHYGSNYFSANNISPTMIKIGFAANCDPQLCWIFANRRTLSEGDIDGINAVYSKRPLTTDGSSNSESANSGGNNSNSLCSCGLNSSNECAVTVSGEKKMWMPVPADDIKCSRSCQTGALSTDPQYRNCKFTGANNSSGNNNSNNGAGNSGVGSQSIGCACGLDTTKNFCMAYVKSSGEALSWTPVTNNDSVTCARYCIPATGIFTSSLNGPKCK